MTKRQTEALSMAALGYTDLAIARIWQRSPRTVRAHLQAAREALGAVNTTHAVAIAMAAGLIKIKLNTLTAKLLDKKVPRVAFKS